MRHPKPYYKDSRKAWYANIGPGKRLIRLASAEEGEPTAWNKYHTLMASRQPVTADSPAASTLDYTVFRPFPVQRYIPASRDVLHPCDPNMRLKSRGY